MNISGKREFDTVQWVCREDRKVQAEVISRALKETQFVKYWRLINFDIFEIRQGFQNADFRAIS